MKTCRACEKECANNAKTCPGCGHRFTGKFTKLFLLIVAGFIILIALSHSNENGQPPATHSSATPPALSRVAYVERRSMDIRNVTGVESSEFRTIPKGFSYGN
jgi:RNA polymerase subunit RPABC4/transcription elongation factor Spt4